MRIVFLCTSGLDYPSPRGRWLPLARYLARAGHEPHLLMLHPTFDRLRRRRFVIEGVHCAYVGQMHVYGLPGERRHFSASELAAVSLRGALALALATVRLRPDVIHVAKPQPINGLAGVLAARSGGALLIAMTTKPGRIISAAHGSNEWWRGGKISCRAWRAG